MICYTLEAARRGIQIDFMENRLQIPILLVATRRVYCVGEAKSAPLAVRSWRAGLADQQSPGCRGGRWKGPARSYSSARAIPKGKCKAHAFPQIETPSSARTWCAQVRRHR